MERNERAVRSNRQNHSHSRIRKLLDEVGAVVDAVESNGSFRSHHGSDLEVFLSRLRTNFDRHAEYEERELFEDIWSDLDVDQRERLEKLVEQHRKIAEALGRAESLFEDLHTGLDADARLFVHFREAVDKLDDAWTRHDRTERELFEELQDDQPD